jgi:hypothetical protein
VLMLTIIILFLSYLCQGILKISVSGVLRYFCINWTTVEIMGPKSCCVIYDDFDFIFMQCTNLDERISFLSDQYKKVKSAEISAH